MSTRIVLLVLFLVSATSNYADSEKKPVRVYTDMVGDLFHYGHMTFLKQAKDLGDILVVGVNTDADAESYKRRPIMTLEERTRAIEGCRYVDEVISGCPLQVTKEWLIEHDIDLVVHGDDFNSSWTDFFYSAPIQMGIFRTVPYTKTVSTSNIIKRILDRAEEFQEDQKVAS